MARLLVIDEDPALRAQLTVALATAGHEVEATGTAAAALTLVRALRPNVVIVGLSLSDPSGIELCRALRAPAPAAPPPSLLVLTSVDEEDQRVAAFEAGADDVVAKPVSVRELLLRIQALTRRRRRLRPDDLLVFGELRIDPAARKVQAAGNSVILSRREFDLLLHLATRAGRVQTRDALLGDVWGESNDSGRVVDTTVKRLRKKLGRVGASIETVRGFGYRLKVD